MTPVAHKVDSSVNSIKSHSSSTNEWNTVFNKRKRSSVIIGTNNSNSASLKGVPKTAVLHVYRVSPDTTSDILKSFVQPHFPEVICDTIKSRFPDKYASFKVTIHEKNFKRAMDPSIWPEDACVQRFFFKAKREQSTP